MKIKNVFITLGVAATMAFGAFVGLKATKWEIKEAKAETYSGSVIIQKNDNDALWDGCNLVAKIFDGSNETWGNVVQNTGHKYQEYSWSGLSFNPTKVIILRVPTSWSSDWGNPFWDGEGGIYARTGDVVLSTTDVVWMAGNATESSNWGTYTLDAVVKGGSSDSWSVATIETALSHVKVNEDNKLEAYGEVELPANSYFKVVKTGNTWCGTYSAHPLIASNLSNSGSGNIHNVAAATYEIYFDYDACTVYITDPVHADADEWAQYFLTHVGCDENGVNLPSGWSACATEYGKLSGGAKDLIYGSDADENGSFIEKAVKRYDVAVANHPSLDKFIKNSSNVVRASSSITSLSTISENGNNVAIIIVVVSTLSLVALGGFFFIKRRKESK